MKPRYRNAIVNGVRAQDFPPLPVDYGYRDSRNFWYHKHRKLLPELLPQRQTTVQSVRYAANRLQTDVQFTDAALEKLVKVPRIFLPTVLKGCVSWAEENNVKLIDVEQMDIINRIRIDFEHLTGIDLRGPQSDLWGDLWTDVDKLPQRSKEEVEGRGRRRKTRKENKWERRQ